MPASLNDHQLAVVRSWVGTKPTDDDLNALFATLGSVDSVILTSLRSQLADILAAPASVTTPDGLSSDNSANIASVEKKIEQFIDEGGSHQDRTPDRDEIPTSSLPGGFQVSRITRYRRRYR